MADVKVPAKLHLMSKTYQKAWYKKHNMEMPKDSEEGGKSAAAAKKVKVAPRKTVAIDPNSVRALNAARQQAYMAKGGRQPIGAMGSGGSNVMAGGGQSTIKDLKASIKAGFNPKVSLDPYESKRAKKKVGPRSLKMKNEEVQIDEVLSPERKRMFDLKLKLIKKVANKKAYTKSSKVDEPRTALNPSKDMKLEPKSMPTVAVGHYKEEVQIDEVTKKEAESMLGGPVKDKPKMPPGKKPAGYRYVRSLARKAMKKGMKEEVEVVEAVKDAADVGEYDYEGDMAKSQLRSILANAKRMHDMLEENTNLPEWVQSKITLAEDYISTAANYMEGEMKEEVEQVDEISEPYGTKKLRRQMAIDDRMAARNAAHPFVEPEWLTKEKEKAKQAAEKAKVKKEEVVAEAEGKVAVTPKEKELAAHHGDKTKITYGDVIKARIKSSKEKLMKGKE